MPGGKRRGGRKHGRPGKGKFNPDDVKNVKHTRMSVWDFYEQKQPELSNIPLVDSSRVETYLEMTNSLPYIWRMMKDIGSIPECWRLLMLYLAVETLLSLIPAIQLWFSGQMLAAIDAAINQRTIDRKLLLQSIGGKLACTTITRLLMFARRGLHMPLNARIKKYYSLHIFRAIARLDLPTFEDPAVQRQLESALPRMARSTIAWQTVMMVSGTVSTGIQLFSQTGVLVNMLRGQPDGPLLAMLSLFQSVFEWSKMKSDFNDSQVWAATTKNEDYIRMQGLKRTVDDPSHRQEIVAGGLSEYMTAQYHETAQRLPVDIDDFYDVWRAYKLRDRLTISSFLNEPLRDLPQIMFILRAVQNPSSIPMSLASMTLIHQTSARFSSSLFQLFEQTGSIADQLASVRKLYEIANIPNRVEDGANIFPENKQSNSMGISIEFRNVSFKYPDASTYALKNTSFKIERGQLCVIVGRNGSGKSTVLKLIARLYDHQEGDILIDDVDIRTLKLADLRQAISVLFQDYTHFPLSIKENIGMGNPDCATDGDRVREAARLGGAEEFINRLPEGFDTYLERPVKDYYSGLPEGTTSLFGRPVDYSGVRIVGNMDSVYSTSLSGGQMQRLAVSRTFMRSLTSESSVGMLLFDEPSASLDPSAEHDLFERLRNLRGNKTMLFSSHRFGNLTRHADLILYMNDAVVVEGGTHDQLIKRQGEYARIWNLQAQAFL